MSIHRGPRIVRDGMILHLDAADRLSYPGSGTLWRDLSGNGNHATTHGDVSFYPYLNKGLLHIQAAGYIDTNLNIDSLNCSISTWVNPMETDIDTYGIILTDNGGWDKGIDLGDGGYWRVHLGNDVGVASGYVDASKWYHVCVVYEPSNVRLYVNGVNIYSRGSAAGASSGSTVQIGRASYAGGSYYYYGDIATVCINNIPLTANQVKQNFEAQKNRFRI